MAAWDDDITTPSERFDKAANRGNDKRITVMIPLTKIWYWLTGRYKRPNTSDRPLSRAEILRRYGSGTLDSPVMPEKDTDNNNASQKGG